MRAKAVLFWEFIKLTRPLFLVGGVLLYLLGAASALSDGADFHPLRFFLGQAMITSVQLMTHYANEFYDLETDRLNTNRTWFSGGSGVIVRGALPQAAAMTAAILFGLLALILTIVAGIQVPQVWIFGLAGLVLAWSYSGPPLTLVKTGWGELSASLVVAGMVPLVGYLMQTGGALNPALLITLLPLILLHFAMLVAFQIPDLEADRSTGKRTIAVRMYLPGVVRLHNASIFVAFCIILALTGLGWPGAQIAWLPVPVAAWQIIRTNRLVRTAQPAARYHWMTARALALFALTTVLWLAGIAVFWIQL